MALNQSTIIYGFGSYFQTGAEASDIDLLLIHEDITQASIQLAIRCKSIIRKDIPNTDTTILSKEEERETNFLHQSRAVFIAQITLKNLPNLGFELTRTLAK